MSDIADTLVERFPHLVRHIIDAIAACGIVGSVTGHLPTISLALGSLWYLVQIITAVRGWFNRKRNFKRRKADDFQN